jgi:hypothetical protein
MKLLGVVSVLLLATAGCSSGHETGPPSVCDLVTSDDVGEAVHAKAEQGVAVPTISASLADKTPENSACKFAVSNELRTVVVSLGKGDAPPNTDPYRAVESHGDAYVIVYSQYISKGFQAAFTHIAELAIARLAP